MSHPFKDWAIDAAIDRAVDRANELGIDDDYFIDSLATIEFEKLINGEVYDDDQKRRGCS